jgi:hypothetical protein
MQWSRNAGAIRLVETASSVWRTRKRLFVCHEFVLQILPLGRETPAEQPQGARRQELVVHAEAVLASLELDHALVVDPGLDAARRYAQSNVVPLAVLEPDCRGRLVLGRVKPVDVELNRFAAAL